MSENSTFNFMRRRRRHQCLTGYLVLVLAAVYPLLARAQKRSFAASEVQVLTPVESSVAAWSPDGQRLAYATPEGIWISRPPSFHEPKRIIRTGTAHAPEQLQWSPNGERIALVSSRPGDNWQTIWLANADGSQVRDLLPPDVPPGATGTRAVGISAWLSNQEIAFTWHCGSGCVGLSKIQVDSGTQASFCIGNLDGDFHWSPQKHRALAEMHLGGFGLVPEESSQQIPRDGSYPSPQECRVVLPGCVFTEDHWHGEEYHFDGWSPEETKVLYTGWSCQKEFLVDTAVNLSLWDIGTGRQEKLLANAGWAMWSPDGTKIAFLLFGEPSYDEAGRVTGTNFTLGQPFPLYLGVMSIATRLVSVVMPLTSGPLEPEGVAEDLLSQRLAPVWSPDGTHLVVRNEQGEVVLVQADGKNVQIIASGRDLRINWSPDGKELALWHRGEDVSTEAQGLAQFLPPVGKEDMMLSDAQIIERYFQQVLPKSGDRYPWFLAEYAQALAEIGKVELAEEQYRNGMARLHTEEKWQEMGMKDFLNGYYATFLCQHGQEKEAREFGGCPPSASPTTQHGQVLRPWTSGRESMPIEDEGTKEKSSSRQPEATVHSSLQ